MHLIWRRCRWHWMLILKSIFGSLQFGKLWACENRPDQNARKFYKWYKWKGTEDQNIVKTTHKYGFYFKKSVSILWTSNRLEIKANISVHLRLEFELVIENIYLKTLYLKRRIHSEAHFAFLCGLHMSCCKCMTTSNPLYLESNRYCRNESRSWIKTSIWSIVNQPKYLETKSPSHGKENAMRVWRKHTRRDTTEDKIRMKAVGNKSGTNRLTCSSQSLPHDIKSLS